MQFHVSYQCKSEAQTLDFNFVTERDFLPSETDASILKEALKDSASKAGEHHGTIFIVSIQKVPKN